MSSSLLGTSVIPKWDNLRSLVAATSDRLTLFTPFYSSNCLNVIQSSIPSEADLLFWTRLRLNDWAFGASDPDALAKLIASCERDSRPYTLYVNQRIHSKAYFADTRLALVGSANLTDGGFENNLEMMVWLSGSQASAALHCLSSAALPQAKPITLDELRAWIEKYRNVVKKIKKSYQDLQSRELEDVERESTGSLGFTETPALDLPSLQMMEQFVSWLHTHHVLAGAQLLLKHNSDRQVQRRQGHFKQCFCGVYCFLQARPEWQPILTKMLGNLPSDAIFEPTETLLVEWKRHLAKYATRQVGEAFSYLILCNVLPPSMGGTRQRGGGAIGTFKRMFPLVARFLFEKSRKRVHSISR
jgi:hypothetical protein